MATITSLQQLEGFYGTPSDRALWKEIDHLSDHYRQFIEASPFLVIASRGESGLDCSPRGDPAGFVRIVDDRTIQIPDRRGNNRLDTLRNIVKNPQVGLIFLVPGAGETIRISGTAEILIDNDLCASFAVNNKPATSIISVTIDKAYYQCQKALVRSGLWTADSQIDRKQLPSAGDMAQYFSKIQGVEFDGGEYDKNYPEYMEKNIY